MEKLIISIEQLNAYIEYRNYISGKEEDPISYFIENRLNWVEEFAPIKDLTQMECICLFSGWYEVKSRINVDDWVYDSVIGKYRKVVADDTSMDIRYLDIIFAEEEIEDLTKIEDPWKIALLELGREIPEFKIGDKYDTDMPFTVTDERGIELLKKAFEEGRVKKFYPVESSIEF